MSFATLEYSIISENENAVFACVPGLRGVESLSKNNNGGQFSWADSTEKRIQ